CFWFSEQSSAFVGGGGVIHDVRISKSLALAAGPDIGQPADISPPAAAVAVLVAYVAVFSFAAIPMVPPWEFAAVTRVQPALKNGGG
ncbi:MAG: hypothetical protein L0H26_03865, partial [Microlunatus sp.]|nr:hypothetical protein [Microlunatus sp.]